METSWNLTTRETNTFRQVCRAPSFSIHAQGCFSPMSIFTPDFPWTTCLPPIWTAIRIKHSSLPLHGHTTTSLQEPCFPFQTAWHSGHHFCLKMTGEDLPRSEEHTSELQSLMRIS